MYSHIINALDMCQEIFCVVRSKRCWLHYKRVTSGVLQAEIAQVTFLVGPGKTSHQCSASSHLQQRSGRTYIKALIRGRDLRADCSYANRQWTAYSDWNYPCDCDRSKTTAVERLERRSG